MGSTRLPGKVLARVADDTLLGHLLSRLRRCRALGAVVVATTRGPEDDLVAAEAAAHGVAVVRGSTSDVLSRYLAAASEAEVDPVVRVTADCPLLDPDVVDEAMSRWRATGDDPPLDLLTNARPGTRTFPRGLDVEVVSRAALARAHAALPASAPEREHVTQHLYRRPDLYRIEELHLPLDLSFLRFTVDEPEDLELVRELYQALHPTHPGFGLRQVLALLAQRPQLLALNAHVRQKGA
jgi:spore coat polysaccharide biosynthesis protein SpsF